MKKSKTDIIFNGGHGLKAFLIEKRMAEQRAAERAKVEKNEPPGPEQPKGRRGRKPTVYG